MDTKTQKTIVKIDVFYLILFTFGIIGEVIGFSLASFGVTSFLIGIWFMFFTVILFRIMNEG